MNKIVDEQFRGEQFKDIFSLPVGATVLWELQSTNRERHPYRKGDLIEAVVVSNPWVNGKVRIKSSIGVTTIVRVTSLYQDKRKVYEQQKEKSQFDRTSFHQGR